MEWKALRDAYLDHLELQGRGKGPHWRMAKHVLYRFQTIVKPALVSDHTLARVDEYLAWKAQQAGRGGKRVTTTTLNSEIRYLNGFANYVNDTDRYQPQDLGLPPGRKLPVRKLFRQERKNPQAYSEAQLADFMTRLSVPCSFALKPIIAGIDPLSWWRTLFQVAFTTGLRKRALLGVPMPSLDDLEQGFLRVPSDLDKSGQERVKPLPGYVVDAILSLGIKPGERLFAWPCGDRAFYNHLHRLQTEAGISPEKHILLHATRRTSATLMLRSGIALDVVSRHLDHANTKITEESYLRKIVGEREQQAVIALPVIVPRTQPRIVL